MELHGTVVARRQRPAHAHDFAVGIARELQLVMTRHDPSPPDSKRRPHWTTLVVWQLDAGVMEAASGEVVAGALDRWRHGAARGLCFVTTVGSNRAVKSEDVDWTDFPDELTR